MGVNWTVTVQESETVLPLFLSVTVQVIVAEAGAKPKVLLLVTLPLWSTLTAEELEDVNVTS